MSEQTKRARDTLTKHARSFSFASFFLGEKTIDKAARLYRFCRVVDDIADEGDCPDTARLYLNSISRDLELGTSTNDVTNDFLSLALECNIDVQAARTLLEGVIFDLDPVTMSDECALDHYCYQVAGTVGLMMSPILGTNDEDALKYACDLGKAMQLTNICRDIHEDALKGRIYIPQTLSLSDITKDPAQENKEMAQACQKLLLRANTLYEKAEWGLAYLPLRSKLCILVASRLYKAIGTKLIKKKCRYWEGRVFTSRSEKIIIALRTLFVLWFNPKFWIKTSYAKD
jgi:phytoene synthase|tara:strand:- start:385 stop:1245 length:861 start_codon:yes stop_codon:yes gene_type:complete